MKYVSIFILCIAEIVLICSVFWTQEWFLGHFLIISNLLFFIGFYRPSCVTNKKFRFVMMVLLTLSGLILLSSFSFFQSKWVSSGDWINLSHMMIKEYIDLFFVSILATGFIGVFVPVLLRGCESSAALPTEIVSQKDNI